MEIQSISGIDIAQRGNIGETRVAHEAERVERAERTQESPRMPERAPETTGHGSAVDAYA
ncbi:MAG TPA: hypothetical protein PLE73_09605 [Spirochaetota bacterium]|nr:hypothetical protein [Spirochaetota bacterium]HOS39180.1 hypothetical protein [Spirochaetota bacterium]HPI23443.1 hypothetical protein [Spirochaetota bacterium]HPU90357.1 hypothetical protein [Spirochaetota bacterium]